MYIGALEVPLVIYMYTAHPAWSWLYLVDPASIPGVTIVALLVLHAGAIFGAWYLSAWLIQTRRSAAVMYGALASGVAALGLAIVCAGRLTAYGSYQAYAAGTTTPLMETKLGYVLIAVIAGMATAYGLVAFELLRDSRRLRNR